MDGRQYGVRAVSAGATALLLLALFAGSALRGQSFDCVLLNDDNTNIFVTPDDCFLLPENALWCNCVRSLFTNPVKGEVSGFNQAIVWILDQPGIANHRVEVGAGTLDLSGLQVGDVIGQSVVNELCPQSVCIFPGVFFTIRSEVKVTAVGANSVDFEIRVVEQSAAVAAILEYDPMSAAHSDGLFYVGRLTSLGAGNGFTLEYRYPSENVDPGVPLEPAVSLGDASDPGFIVRFLMEFFTTESGIYTLPDDDSIDVTTTLRRFPEDTLEAILPLGAADLCVEGPLGEPEPCKIILEELQIKNTLEENSPPTAIITMVDPETAVQLFDPALLTTVCGSARVIFRGGNSDDGDGGTQGLSYEWFVADGPEGGASVPEETRNFKDTEITFTMPGEYLIGLRVDDGQAADNEDEVQAVVVVNPGLDLNIPPTAVIQAISPAGIPPLELELVQGEASATFDGSGSSNGFPGEDDCMQELSFLWRQADGPAGIESVIVSPAEPATEVRFSFPGEYVIELEVDDGQEEDNLATAQVEVRVTGEPLLARFRRGDADANAELNLTDPIRILNWLFLGGPVPPCLDAADADDSGDIVITDAINILEFLFLGGGPPPSPGPSDCGPDSENDDLATCVYESC